MFKKFFSDNTLKVWKLISFIVIWSIWLSKNKALFKDKLGPPWVTSCQEEASIKGYTTVVKQKRNREVSQLTVDKSRSHAFFDGASQSQNSRGGLCFLLFLNDNHVYQFKSHLGEGRNNKGGDNGLFLLTQVGISKGIFYP